MLIYKHLWFQFYFKRMVFLLMLFYVNIKSRFLPSLLFWVTKMSNYLFWHFWFFFYAQVINSYYFDPYQQNNCVHPLHVKVDVILFICLCQSPRLSGHSLAKLYFLNKSFLMNFSRQLYAFYNSIFFFTFANSCWL